jgi:hypothetical protein
MWTPELIARAKSMFWGYFSQLDPVFTGPARFASSRL